MPAIIDISIAVPEYVIEQEEMLKFYSRALRLGDKDPFLHKLSFINKKTRIEKRYSCLPDFTTSSSVLFRDGNYNPPVEDRMEIYRQQVVPLAAEAIAKLFSATGVEAASVTHLITVSCTGLTAPGIEFQLAEQFGLQHVEKIALNFLGCYAAMKALKQANYIALAQPEACVLIVCAELCSLHFSPSDADEDVVANLLFADGASAVMVCGDKSLLIKNKVVLKMNDLGTAYIPSTFELMTWNVTSTNFKMYLSKHVAATIRENIEPVVNTFLKGSVSEIDFWAIHPGGVKIVEAVRDKLGLNNTNVEDSMQVLQQFGNMSSPTILFILNSILNKIRNDSSQQQRNIFSCAFGPGINIEMIRFSSVNTALVMEPSLLDAEYEFKV